MKGLMLVASAVLVLGAGAAAFGQEASAADAVAGHEARDLAAPGIMETTLDPDEYILGPGDVLEIGFWGDVNRTETVTVNPDGDVLIAPVGPVRVDGLTLAEVNELVKSRLSPYYKPGILSVSLITLRRFQVHVVGGVATPGAVEANAVTRVSQAVEVAGGTEAGGSLRNIELRRGDEVLRVDLARYLLTGDTSSDPYLEGGDVVYVPRSAGSVEVFGSVHMPGQYEFVKGETVGDLIRLAGGFTPDAELAAVEVRRFDKDDPSVSVPLFFDAGGGKLDAVDVSLGDRVFVRSIPDWHRIAMVQVIGEVKYPGNYVIVPGVERLTEIVERAGGFTERASLAEARLLRGSYSSVRLPIENELTAVADLGEAGLGDDLDLLRTMSRETKGLVSVDFEDVFFREHPGYDPPLYDGDVIEIPAAMRFVRVAGQVGEPGLVPFKEGEDYEYYIRWAGGFAGNADTRGTRILRGSSGARIGPRGQVLRPGDIVWVPRKPEADWWEITKDVLQIAAQIATIYLVVDSVTGK